MIKGFGGKDSDNFAKFLVFTGAAFLTLRRHNNIHSLLSHICNMVHAGMADLSINQPPDEAILAMRGRFRLGFTPHNSCMVLISCKREATRVSLCISETT